MRTDRREETEQAVHRTYFFIQRSRKNERSKNEQTTVSRDKKPSFDEKTSTVESLMFPVVDGRGGEHAKMTRHLQLPLSVMAPAGQARREAHQDRGHTPVKTFGQILGNSAPFLPARCAKSPDVRSPAVMLPRNCPDLRDQISVAEFGQKLGN